MPLKRPKAKPLPKPFPDIEHQHPEADRFRIMQMARELDSLAGVSWNAPRLGIKARLMTMPAHRAFAIFPALGMGAAIVAGLFVAADTGFQAGPRIIWVQSWGEDRTGRDAIETREQALADLRADIERTLEVVEPRAATDPDAASHAAALRRWAAMAEAEGAQRQRELEARAKTEPAG
jgi:hypothetical protein